MGTNSVRARVKWQSKTDFCTSLIQSSDLFVVIELHFVTDWSELSHASRRRLHCLLLRAVTRRVDASYTYMYAGGVNASFSRCRFRHFNTCYTTIADSGPFAVRPVTNPPEQFTPLWLFVNIPRTCIFAGKFRLTMLLTKTSAPHI